MDDEINKDRGMSGHDYRAAESGDDCGDRNGAILAQTGIRRRGCDHQPGGARFVFAEEGSAIRMLRFRNASIAGRILQVRTMIPGP